MNRKNKRIVNLRYMVDGLHFDAAVDCDWTLHCYAFESHDRQDETPIELYCFDKPEWDIRMIFHKEPETIITNSQQRETTFGGIYNTCANLGEIIKETKAWIKEMTNKDKDN